MNKIKFIFAGMIISATLLTSCGNDEQETKQVGQPSSKVSRKAESLEMKNFKEALIQLAKTKVAAEKNGSVTSLLDERNHDVIIKQSKELLLANGYTSADLNTDNRAVIKLAMKVYAEKTQMIINN